jgi:hypothetical protein
MDHDRVNKHKESMKKRTYGDLAAVFSPAHRKEHWLRCLRENSAGQSKPGRDLNPYAESLVPDQ